LAQETGLIKRQRKLTGASFAQTLVFGWLSNPDATLDELAQTATAIGVEITPESVFQRFTPDASQFLKRMLDASIEPVISANPVAIEVLKRFSGVYLLDSSIVTLPDELAAVWQGCGGSEKNSSASVKLSVCWNMTCGDFSLHIESGRTQDKSSPLATESLPVDALRIADLGYFSLSRLAQMSDDGFYWLTRVKVQCTLTCDANSQARRYQLYEFLQSQDANCIDVNILLGKTEKLECRLLAALVPKEIANQRRRQLRARLKRKGKTPSKRQLQMADWIVLATNAPEELLSLEEAIVLMRFRWQIELLFKLWKQHGRIDKWRSEKPWRILCELYAKLIGMIVQHWLLLTSAWENPARSLVKAVKTIRRHAMQVACAVANGQLHRLIEVCQMIASCLATGCRMNKRKKEPNTYQLLLALEEKS
jgi:hypothetical protein